MWFVNLGVVKVTTIRNVWRQNTNPVFFIKFTKRSANRAFIKVKVRGGVHVCNVCVDCQGAVMGLSVFQVHPTAPPS